MELVSGSRRSSAVTPVGCCWWRGPTDLITLSRSRRFRPSCGLNFLPPTQKRSFHATISRKRRRGGRLSISKSIKAKGDGVEMDWNGAGGESARRWTYVFFWRVKCQSWASSTAAIFHLRARPSDESIQSFATAVGKWISGDWIRPNASLCFESLSNYWQLPVALSALATSPSSPLKTTCYLTPSERDGGVCGVGGLRAVI